MTPMDFILANRKLKLLSLFAAVVLWLFVTLETRDEAELPLTVRPVNMPAWLTVEPQSLPLVHLRVAGPRTLIIRQRLKGTQVDLDLSGAAVGVTTVSLLERSVRLVPGLAAVMITPATARIVLLENGRATKIN